MFPQSFLTLIAAGAVLLAAPSVTFAKTITETFAPSSGLRKSGQPLHGSLAIDGQTRWIATPNLLYPDTGDKDAGVNVDSVRGFVGKLPLPANTRFVRVTATLRPVSPDKQNNWSAVGIGNPGASTLNITWDAGLLLLVHADGRFALSYNDPKAPGESRIRIQSEMAPGRQPDRPVVATLQYDQAKGTVSAWINEREVVDNFDLKGRGYTPDLSHAGFSGYQQPPDIAPVSTFILETRP